MILYLIGLSGMWKACMLKIKENLRIIIFVILGVLLVVSNVVLIRTFSFGEKEEKTIVGMVLVGDHDDPGWNSSHFDGVSDACKSLGCDLVIKESVPEEENKLFKAVKELAAKNCDLIFLTSNGYGEYIDEISAGYPDIAFYSTSADGGGENSTSYFIRMYQARYLAGIVAGASTKTYVLGAVVAKPIPEIDRGINAFAMGARRVNPNIEVVVYYTGSWDDEEKEREAVRALAAKDADVITYHVAKPYAIDEAEKLGLFSIGYEGVYGDYSERFLTASMAEWDVVYKKILSDYLSGRANFSNSYWMGIEDGAVHLHACSDLVDNNTRQLVESEKARIQTWRDVFSGEIYDNEGLLRCAKDERFSDDELFRGMDWFVNGVEIYGED